MAKFTLNIKLSFLKTDAGPHNLDDFNLFGAILITMCFKTKKIKQKNLNQTKEKRKLKDGIWQSFRNTVVSFCRLSNGGL